ncbi:MAG: hypothetical protein IKW89_07560 [Bacteroidales bacterium]|nr:hypothetical protein [Bacteroidales bacterium]
MRKTLFISLSLLLACCAGAPKSEVANIATIRDGWRGKTIETKNLGSQPNVMQLLRAFNEVWPSAGADSIITEAGDRLFVSNDVTEGGSGKVFVDCEDFFIATFNPGNTGDKRTEARTYSRENGHTLFAVLLEQVHTEEMEFCCFYDYDPSTGVMTPEDEPYADFKPQHAGSILTYWLTEGDYDQDIIIVETSPDDSYPTAYHHYTFNGMKHEFSYWSNEFIYPEYEDEHDFLPEEAVLRAESENYWLYTSVAEPASDDDPEITVLWVRSKEDDVVTQICVTSPDSEPKWASMTDGNAIPVKVGSGDIAVVENVQAVPWDPDKFYLDGCPDARNIWSYIIDVSDPDNVRAIQFPSTEGFISFDSAKRRIHLGAYRYHDEGGRYSVEQVYTIDGKFISEEVIGDE